MKKTGVCLEHLQTKLVPCVLYLFLLSHLILAAPGQPGSQREKSVDAQPPSGLLPNPFGSRDEDRRMLQSYIQSSLKDGQGGPEINTWEQEVFFLFRMYDYDRSGLLDGLEMMKLLSDYNSHHTPGAQANDMVVSMVDFLLQTQDLNQDGLLAPSELLSPPLPHTQDSDSNKAPNQEQEAAAVEEKPPNVGADEEQAGAAEQREEEQPQHEVQTEEELMKQVDEQDGQHIPEATEEDHGAPVHQGQPEI